MAEILGAGFSTLTDLVSQIRTAVGDTVSANRKWSDDQIYLAIKNSLAQAGNNFFTLHKDSTNLVLAVGTLSYTLPGYMQRVRVIRRERRQPDIQIDTGTTLDYEDLSGWKQYRMPGSNLIVFDRGWPAGNTEIFYERDVAIPLVDCTLSAAISSTTATSMTLSIPGTYSIYEIDFPSYFQINNAEIVQVTAVTAPATATISRGALGTTAATASSGAAVAPVLVENDDRLGMYIVNSAAAYLNMLMLQSANRGSDVAGNLTAMREFQMLAKDALRKKSVRPQPRRIQPERRRSQRAF